MLELLLETLKTFEGVEWRVRETRTRRLENYNIKKQSEMLREVETTRLMLTLYVTFSEGDKKYRGSYDTEIHPGASANDIRAKIEQGAYAAGFVKNEWYPLVSPSSGGEPSSEGANAPDPEGDDDDAAALESLQGAFFSGDCREGGHLSYSEFFITRRDERILNSSGVDVRYRARSLFVETAVHWKGKGEKEIEIFECYNASLPVGSGDVSAAGEMLKRRVADLFAVAEQKSMALPTPQVGDVNILLSGECLATLFDCYSERANVQMIYQQLSTFKEGEQVQGAGAECDRVSLTLDPRMEGSSHSRPYDNDGTPLDSHEIIRGGKLLRLWGDARFSSYLGAAPTGNIANVRVSGGTVAAADMRIEPYLELVSFSDFQADAVTGDFGSEIRLGFYFDGEKTVPVTGGSISGNIATVQDTMRMSTEERQYDHYRGPATICIRGASIAGNAG